MNFSWNYGRSEERLKESTEHQQHYVITIFKRLLYKASNGAKVVLFDEAIHMELTQSLYEEMLIALQTDEGLKAKLQVAMKKQLSGRQIAIGADAVL